jgi:hypothetical protein
LTATSGERGGYEKNSFKKWILLQKNPPFRGPDRALFKSLRPTDHDPFTPSFPRSSVEMPFGSIPPHDFHLRNNSIPPQIPHAKIQPQKTRFPEKNTATAMLQVMKLTQKPMSPKPHNNSPSTVKHRDKPTWRPESAQQFTHNNSRKVP